MTSVVAILAVRNEERFLPANLAHLARHGVHAYVIDNGSTDATYEIAEANEAGVVVGRERMAYDGTYRWIALLERKEELALELDADWLMHLDADEFRAPPGGVGTLAEAFAASERAGYNAVDFLEFTFVPTREEPDHDRPDFLETMRWYYPFRPFSPHQLKAWKRQPARVSLAEHAGHRVDFPGLRVEPDLYVMRHYLFLSGAHVAEKYLRRRYDEAELARGWHGPRSRLTEADIELPSQRDLRLYTSDAELDPSAPRTRHLLFEGV